MTTHPTPHPLPTAYKRRQPERSTLHQAITQHLPHLHSRLDHEGRALPPFVELTFERYLSCGQLQGGFVRLYCSECKHNRLIAFSCKRRGLCPSCAGRVMTQRAMRQREAVIPAVRNRQWVLTFPRPLHTYLAYFPHALTDALDLFIETLRYHYQRRCLPAAPSPPESFDVDYINAYYRPRYPHDIGALTSVQRHTDALSLYPHFHTLTTDGLFVARSSPQAAQSTLRPRAPVDDAVFITAEPLSSEDLQEILVLYQRRLTRRFIRRGYLRPNVDGLPAAEQTFSLFWGAEPPSEEEQQLLKCYAASAQLRHAFGPRAGHPLELDLADVTSDRPSSHELCVSYAGFNIHANTVIEAEDRDRLEQMCRYIQRPVIAKDRLKKLEDGRFYYAFKRQWKSGARGIFFEGPDLLERLVALIPPPRKHQTRYHGVYAPHSRFQRAIKHMTTRFEQALSHQARQRRHVYWVLWAELLKRTFREDVERCPHCTSTLQRISLITTPEAIIALIAYDESARGPP